MRKIHITNTLFLILLTFSFALPASAQGKGAQSDGRAAHKTAAVAGSRQLRFASQRPVEHLRLQVHDGAGALIHDSGLVPKSDLVWSFGDVLKRLTASSVIN